jgi:hypothetical protein
MKRQLHRLTTLIACLSILSRLRAAYGGEAAAQAAYRPAARSGCGKASRA